MNAKQFKLSAILSVTTKVMCTNDIDDLYEILNYMTDDDLYTHDLPRAGTECEPFLYEQLPFLREISPADILPDKTLPREQRIADCLAKVKALSDKYGEYHTVYPIGYEDHERLAPDEALRRLGFNGNIISIDASDNA